MFSVEVEPRRWLTIKLVRRMNWSRMVVVVRPVVTRCFLLEQAAETVRTVKRSEAMKVIVKH